jgi:glycosyltransferase involved in cell wall biosynthesis
MKPKVTIGVCVRNCEDCVREALNSILDQDFPHELMELILVDDGSEDKTLSVANSYVSNITMRAKVFHHDWKGLGPSRNVVVDNAGGDYIIWVDGDMMLPKDHVRKQVDFMEQNPNVGIAKARYGLLPGENIVAALENIPFMMYDLYPKYESATSKLPGTGGSIYRVRAVNQVGGFANSIKGGGEDTDAAYRVKAAGWLIKRSPAVFYERARQTWQDLWKQYFYHGYGLYSIYRKNRKIFSLFKMVPVAGFVTGFLFTFDGYRLTRRKSVLLLPFHFAFKMTAWCAGFAKSKADFAHHMRVAAFN